MNTKFVLREFLHIGLQGTTFNKLLLGNFKACGAYQALKISLNPTFHYQELPDKKLLINSKLKF